MKRGRRFEYERNPGPTKRVDEAYLEHLVSVQGGNRSAAAAKVYRRAYWERRDEDIDWNGDYDYDEEQGRVAPVRATLKSLEEQAEYFRNRLPELESQIELRRYHDSISTPLRPGEWTVENLEMMLEEDRELAVKNALMLAKYREHDRDDVHWLVATEAKAASVQKEEQGGRDWGAREVMNDNIIERNRERAVNVREARERRRAEEELNDRTGGHMDAYGSDMDEDF